MGCDMLPSDSSAEPEQRRVSRPIDQRCRVLTARVRPTTPRLPQIEIAIGRRQVLERYAAAVVVGTDASSGARVVQSIRREICDLVSATCRDRNIGALSSIVSTARAEATWLGWR
jgi:hypothetical protein